MTSKQKQCLLAYLGYYTGNIDGDWGEKSQKATVDFQRAYDLDDDGVFGKNTKAKILSVIGSGVESKVTAEKPKGVASWWKEIKYFDRDEFRCPCGKCGGFPVEPEEALVRIVDAMRGAFGKAVIIVPPDGHSGGSGVRCQSYNDSLSGSSKTSRHLKGKAVDFSAPGVSASTIETYLNKLKSSGKIRYWYKICPGSYHMDIE